MNKLLKFEFHKLGKQKSFRVCSIIMIVMSLIAALTMKAVISNPELAAKSDISISAVLLKAISSSSFSMIASIFVVIYICDDFEQKTIKNIFSRGYSRTSVYTSKMIACVTAVTIMFLISVVSAMVFGNIYGMDGSISGKAVIIILVQYLAQLANMLFCFALASYFRKNGAAIAAALVAPILVNMVIGLIDSVLKTKDNSLSKYWMSSFQAELETSAISDSRITVIAVLSLIYIVVFAAGGIAVGKKTEL